MLQVVKYEIDHGILIVGFKDSEQGFVVYASLAYDESKTKNELLQLAYMQTKDAIEYEKTQTEHAFTTDEVGEEFIPEQPKPDKITILCDDMVEFGAFDEEKTLSLNAEIFDQYGEPYDGDVTWSSTHGTFSGSVLSIPKVEVYTEVTVTAQIGVVSNSKTIRLFPYQEPPVVDEQVNSEMVAIAEAIIDLDSRLRVLEGGN